MNQKGQSLVEILIAIALTALIVPALFLGFVTSQQGKAQEGQRLQAQGLVDEAKEALRSYRNESWATLQAIPIGTPYHPVFNSSLDAWEMQSGGETGIDGVFDRSITISNVYRDASGDLSLSGTLDPSTKQATITVSWGALSSQSIQEQVLFTRYLDSVTMLETTTADFADGTLTDVLVSNDQVSLAYLGGVGGAGANWCNPSAYGAGQYDVPGSGAANAITAILGEAFIGTGANNSGPALQRITGLSANPPVPADGGTFSGNYKTNDIFGDSTHMYITTDTGQKEVVIVQKSPLQEVGVFNPSGNSRGQSIFVSTLGSNTFGFVTLTNNNLYVFDLTSSKSGSRPQRDSKALGALGTSVYVVGNYAYVTRNSTSEQLRVYAINSTTGVLTLTGSFTVPSTNGLNGALGAQDVYVSADGTRAYMVTARSTAPGQHEFFLIDTTIKNNLVLKGSYDETTGMNPRAVDMVLSGQRAIMVGSGGTEYQVLRLADENNPVLCGQWNLSNAQGQDTAIYDVASVEITADNRAYAYIAVADGDEFRVIQGGTGGEFEPLGIYESSTLPTSFLSFDAAFNRFADTSVENNGSVIDYQFAIADQNPPGSCSGVNFTNLFVGPDGTSNTYYSDDSPLFMHDDNLTYENPGRCLRYRAYLRPSADFLTSPSMQDMTINYTP